MIFRIKSKENLSQNIIILLMFFSMEQITVKGDPSIISHQEIICDKVPSFGNCVSLTEEKHFYFDHFAKRCKEKIASCSMNQNAFSSLQECQNRCDPCESEPQVGVCSGEVGDDSNKSVYYDINTNTCIENPAQCFQGPNAHNSLNVCRTNCDICSMTREVKVCNISNMERYNMNSYYFDGHQCKEVEDTLCLSGRNQFHLPQSCWRKCLFKDRIVKSVEETNFIKLTCTILSLNNEVYWEFFIRAGSDSLIKLTVGHHTVTSFQGKSTEILVTNTQENTTLTIVGFVIGTVGYYRCNGAVVVSKVFYLKIKENNCNSWGQKRHMSCHRECYEISSGEQVIKDDIYVYDTDVHCVRVNKQNYPPPIYCFTVFCENLLIKFQNVSTTFDLYYLRSTSDVRQCIIKCGHEMITKITINQMDIWKRMEEGSETCVIQTCNYIGDCIYDFERKKEFICRLNCDYFSSSIQYHYMVANDDDYVCVGRRYRHCKIENCLPKSEYECTETQLNFTARKFKRCTFDCIKGEEIEVHFREVEVSDSTEVCLWFKYTTDYCLIKHCIDLIKVIPTMNSLSEQVDIIRIEPMWPPKICTLQNEDNDTIIMPTGGEARKKYDTGKYYHIRNCILQNTKNNLSCRYVLNMAMAKCDPAEEERINCEGTTKYQKVNSNGEICTQECVSPSTCTAVIRRRTFQSIVRYELSDRMIKNATLHCDGNEYTITNDVSIYLNPYFRNYLCVITDYFLEDDYIDP